MHQLYENIKARRMELNMSQSTLADKIGYSDKGMISRIESGQIDLSLSKVEAIAEALRITPSALMGWDETEIPTALSDGQSELLKLFSNCDPDHQQSAVLALKDGQLSPGPLE